MTHPKNKKDFLDLLDKAIQPAEPKGEGTRRLSDYTDKKTRQRKTGGTSAKQSDTSPK